MALPACIQPRPALQVFGFIPPGCIGFFVEDDHSDPFLREGEFAVIDVMDRTPVHEALFLIQWQHGQREIVEALLRPTRASSALNGEHWWTGIYNRPRSRQEVEQAFKAGKVVATMDGPYADVAYLAEKLVGRVIGVLAPDRHSWEELGRIRDVATCPAHILPTGYRPKPANYIEPAGSLSYHVAKPRRRRRAS